MDRILIESARRGDVQAILQLLRANGLPDDDLVSHLETAIVARLHDDHIVGCAALEVYEDGTLLRSLAVTAEARGTGIGQRLTRAALALADRLDAPAVFLLTTTAADYFPRFGFAVVERSAVPAGVRRSVEFRSACPASATIMKRAR